MKRAMAWALAAITISGIAMAQDSEPDETKATLPITELTVFKDGHAYVTREGALPVNEAGEASMDDVPVPLLGTFWPYSRDDRATLTGVIAGTHDVDGERKANDLLYLLEINEGAEVRITDTDGKEISGKARKMGEMVLIETPNETIVLRHDRIRDVAFIQAPTTSRTVNERRNQLTFHLDWKGAPPADQVQAGLTCVQKGLRWVPCYRVDLDGEGHAAVQFEAVVINELADFSHATLRMVVGVPSFPFADQLDPMGLIQNLGEEQARFMQLSNGDFSNTFSNLKGAYQLFDRGYITAGAFDASGSGLGPQIGGTQDEGDLFVFTMEDQSLAKGERMALPVAEYNLTYEDIYSVVIPPLPPQDVREQFNDEQQARLAQMSNHPNVVHSTRLDNTSDHPLTTAPALVTRQGALLAQSMMTYAPQGSKVDLELTKAVDIRVFKEDNESERAPNMVAWNGTTYQSVHMEGSLRIVNRHDKPVTVEIIRYAWGNVDAASDEADVKQVNVFETDGATLGVGWDTIRSMPDWWRHFNGIGRITWTIDLEPGESTERTYEWHYFSR